MLACNETYHSAGLHLNLRKFFSYFRHVNEIAHIVFLIIPAVYYPMNDTWNEHCVDMPDPDAFGLPFFPEKETNYSIPQYEFEESVACFNRSTSAPFPKCLSPLKGGSGAYCMFGCPLPDLSEHEILEVQLMQGITSWVSVVPTSC